MQSTGVYFGNPARLMSDGTLIGRLLAELIPVASSAVSDDELSRQFSDIIASTFGIDRVSLDGMREDRSPASSMEGYLLNTRKPYVDNQLSDFSSFPELIDYRNEGFKSCALMPVIVSGRLIAVLRMLSNAENRFDEGLMSSVSFGAYLVGFALMYRRENSRNLGIANYFNGAFNSTVPQVIVSSNGTIVKSNAGAIKLFEPRGADATRSIGMDFDQLCALAGKSAKVQQGKRIYSVSASKISDRLVHVALQDVTDLEKLGAVVAAMGGSAQMGAVFLDAELNVAAATDAFLGVAGYPEEMLQGKSLMSLIKEGSRQELKQAMASKGAKPLQGFIEVVGASGASTHLRYTLAGYALGYVMVFHNAQAESRIDAVNAALADFVSNTSELVMTVDALGYIRECNMPVEEMLRYSRSELIGRDVKSVYAEPALFERDVKYVIAGTKVDNSYVDFIAKDNGRIATACSMRIVRDMEGNASYVIVAKELETKRRLEDQDDRIKELESDAKKIKADSDLKSQFIYNITHELKTPLTNIKGFSSLLYNGEFGALNEDQKNYVSTINQESDRLMLIIQQVLDATKLEAKKVKLETKEVDLAELANGHSIGALREAAQNKGLAFSWTVAYDVPKIVADPNRLIQVFVNLIGNSVKFTEQGSIAVKAFKKSRRRIECDVIDTGIGISDDDRRKIFRKFYEAPKKGLIKQDGAGTGLGLSITKEIIKLHGGKIGFESQLGKGSKFWFILPVKPEAKRKGADQAM